MREQELEPLQWVDHDLKRLKPFAGLLSFSLIHHLLRTETSWRLRTQRGLLQIQENVADVRTFLIERLDFYSGIPYDQRTLVVLFHDVMRLLSGLEHMDFERAIWKFITSPQTCDRTFKRFVEFSSLLSSFHRESLNWCDGDCCWLNQNYKIRGCTIEGVGSALWQVSCHIPRDLSPSPPPPPYTLYAFNIELPPIRYPTVMTRRSSVGQSLRIGMRRQSISEDVDTLRPSMRRICDVEDVEEIRRGRQTGFVWEDDEDEDEHPPAKRRLLNEPENVEYIREQRLLRFQRAA